MLWIFVENRWSLSGQQVIVLMNANAQYDVIKIEHFSSAKNLVLTNFMFCLHLK